MKAPAPSPVALGPVEYLACRAMRHGWERMDGPPPGWQAPDSQMWAAAHHEIHLCCIRCGTWRHVAIDHLGGLLRSTYSYPGDYLLPAGEGRIPGDDLRLWLARPGRPRRISRRS